MLLLPEEEALRKARSRLLRLLGYRARSRREAEEYLRRKGFDDAVNGAVLEEMERLRYIDDRSFTGEYLDSCLRRGWGPLRARHGLLAKGIAPHLIEEGMERCYSAADEEALARKVLAKRAPSGTGEGDAGELRRQIGYLRRRGFHDHIIMKTLKEPGLLFYD